MKKSTRHWLILAAGGIIPYILLIVYCRSLSLEEWKLLKIAFSFGMGMPFLALLVLPKERMMCSGSTLGMIVAVILPTTTVLLSMVFKMTLPRDPQFLRWLAAGAPLVSTAVIIAYLVKLERLKQRKRDP